MNWGSAGEFFTMGGYGLYVWGSYAVTVIAIALELGVLFARRRNALRQVRETARSPDPGDRDKP